MHSLSKQASKTIVCLFFCGVLLLGFVTAGDYGRPWDESDEMDILRMNLWEYARAFQMDESIFQQWAERGSETISVMTPIGDSIEQDHGAAAFYPMAAIVLDLNLTEHSRMDCWHLYCWVLFTLGLFALYACCRQLGLSMGVGLLAALFMLLSPRFFAEGHYNNKDIVLMSLSLCVLWQGLRLMKKPTFPRALGFALAGAFAANTKVVGLALWGLCALFVLLFQKKWNRRVVMVGVVTLASFLGLYALITPALWRSPMTFISYLVNNALAFGRWENYVRFRGTTFLLANERLPWYYLPYMIFATTPLWALLMTGVGQLAAFKSLVQRRREIGSDGCLTGLLLCSLLWLMPLLFAVLTRTTVYNGWRHFYFLYGFMLVLAAYGVSRLFNWLGRRRFLRGAFCAMLALCMAFTGVGLVTQHPYQFAYYQPVVRLKADNGYLELDYWNLSVMDALTALAQEPLEESRLTIGYADLWAQAGLKRTLPAMRPEIACRFRLTDDPSKARYILANPTYTLFSGFEPPPALSEVVTLSAYGRPIMRIYRNHAFQEENP